MLSQKSRYALRALLVLAARGDASPMQISEIADSAKLPRKFLEQILLELKKSGIVRSHRGRLGGYSLGGRPRISALPMCSGSLTVPWRSAPASA